MASVPGVNAFGPVPKIDFNELVKQQLSIIAERPPTFANLLEVGMRNVNCTLRDHILNNDNGLFLRDLVAGLIVYVGAIFHADHFKEVKDLLDDKLYEMKKKIQYQVRKDALKKDTVVTCVQTISDLLIRQAEDKDKLEKDAETNLMIQLGRELVHLGLAKFSNEHSIHMQGTQIKLTLYKGDLDAYKKDETESGTVGQSQEPNQSP